MPKRDVHLQLHKRAKQYGPVYSLILGTQTLVVLSSDQAVKDLLDRRSSLYSHRQEMYIGQKLASGDLRLLMMVRCHILTTCLSSSFAKSGANIEPGCLGLWSNLEIGKLYERHPLPLCAATYKWKLVPQNGTWAFEFPSVKGVRAVPGYGE